MMGNELQSFDSGCNASDFCSGEFRFALRLGHRLSLVYHSLVQSIQTNPGAKEPHSRPRLLLSNRFKFIIDSPTICYIV
jgi:hypothetical protein